MLRLLNRKSVVGLTLVALICAGCGDDDAATTDTTQAPAADDMADDEMADDEMADDEMASDDDEMADDEMASGDVLEVAAAEGDLNTFLAALEAAQIMDGLHGPGPFTVFIPTDAAFSAYLDGTGMSQAEVFADPAALQGLLNHHIVNGTEDADMVMSMADQSFETVAGTPLEVSVDGDTVMVGGATVERYDITASNGVIHVIDAVLVPPGS